MRSRIQWKHVVVLIPAVLGLVAAGFFALMGDGRSAGREFRRVDRARPAASS